MGVLRYHLHRAGAGRCCLQSQRSSPAHRSGYRSGYRGDGRIYHIPDMDDCVHGAGCLGRIQVGEESVLMRTLQAILIAIILLLGLVSPIFAIADPDTPPSVNAVYVFDFDDGSTGVLIDYYLDYAALPTETATEAYLAIFIDTDGATQLKAVAPYTFVDSGYGRGLIWIPFTAAETTAYSIDNADQALYRIWLVGNPTLAWAGDPPKTIATIDQWNTTGDMSVLLAIRVLYYADVLELAWSLG